MPPARLARPPDEVIHRARRCRQLSRAAPWGHRMLGSLTSLTRSVAPRRRSRGRRWGRSRRASSAGRPFGLAPLLRRLSHRPGGRGQWRRRSRRRRRWRPRRRRRRSTGLRGGRRRHPRRRRPFTATAATGVPRERARGCGPRVRPLRPPCPCLQAGPSQRLQEPRLLVRRRASRPSPNPAARLQRSWASGCPRTRARCQPIARAGMALRARRAAVPRGLLTTRVVRPRRGTPVARRARRQRGRLGARQARRVQAEDERIIAAPLLAGQVAAEADLVSVGQRARRCVVAGPRMQRHIVDEGEGSAAHAQA